MTLQQVATKIEYHQQQLVELRRLLPDADYREITETCCQVAGVPQSELFGVSRRDDAVACRCIVAKELRQSGFLLKSIAEIMGKHHTTVIYYLNQYKDRHRYDPRFRIKAESCSAAVQAFSIQFEETEN